MRKIRYVIPKREQIMMILLFLSSLSFIYLFEYNTYLNSFYKILYTYRYLLYLTLYLPVFKFIINKFYNNFVLIIKIDDEKKFFIKTMLFNRIKLKVHFSLITKIKIINKSIVVFFLENDKENDKENNNKFHFKIPLICGGFINKDDFLYIINIFNNDDVEYVNTTQEKVIISISKQIYKHRNIVVNIICIFAFLILLINIFYTII